MTTAADLDQALATGMALPERRTATPSAPSPVQAAGAVASLGIDKAAATMARKYGAVGPDGVVRCIRCIPGRERPGQLPHLCCGPCIAEWRRQHGGAR